MRFNPGFIFVGDGRKNVAFQLRGAAHHVFTGDDVQRCFNALCFTLRQAFRNRRGDTLKHHRTHGGGDQINARDEVNHVVANATYRVDARDRFNLFVFTHHVNLIAMTGIQGIQNHLIHIGECQGNARVCQQFTDKSTTDITCAKM